MILMTTFMTLLSNYIRSRILEYFPPIISRDLYSIIDNSWCAITVTPPISHHHFQEAKWAQCCLGMRILDKMMSKQKYRQILIPYWYQKVWNPHYRFPNGMENWRYQTNYGSKLMVNISLTPQSTSHSLSSRQVTFYILPHSINKQVLIEVSESFNPATNICTTWCWLNMYGRQP